MLHHLVGLSHLGLTAFQLCRVLGCETCPLCASENETERHAIKFTPAMFSTGIMPVI